MPSTAQVASGSVVAISTAEGSPITITGITSAEPPVVTATNTLNEGEIVYINGVVGMDPINARAYVVGNPTASNFELRGIDATNYGTYQSGGTATPQTMSKIGNLKTFDLPQDESPTIETTNLDSIRQEKLPGVPGSWSMSNDIDIDADDTGQKEASKAQENVTLKQFTLTLRSGKVFAGSGYVTALSATGDPETAVSGSLTLLGTGGFSWFV